MPDASEYPMGFRFPKAVISYTVYLYHRFLHFYRDVQELPFKRGVDVSHETVRVWCTRFGPAIAEALRHRKLRRGQIWHLDEMRVASGGITCWLWRAVNEQGEVVAGRTSARAPSGSARRFFRRLIDDQGLPERIATDGLRNYGAALREVPKLTATEHIRVSAAERQNNLIEQSHRPTRKQKRRQRNFRSMRYAQRFLFTHAEVPISSVLPVQVFLLGYAAAT